MIEHDQQILDLRSWQEIGVYLYINFPETIQSDDVLVKKYEEIMKCKLNASKVNTLCRVGRKLRNSYPVKFMRDEEYQKKCRERQKVFEEWALE